MVCCAKFLSGRLKMKTRLKELRILKEVTQKDVADKINCAVNTYSKYERGDREPDIDTLKRLSRYFGVSIDHILYND